MKRIIIAYVFCYATLAKIPGVPHDLRRHFKSSHKFKEETQVFNGRKVKIRRAPDSRRLVLVYGVDPREKDRDVISKLIAPQLNEHYSFIVKKATSTLREYEVRYKNKVIENAYVKFYVNDDETLAIGINTPYKNLEPVSFPNSFEKKRFPLVLVEGVLVEKSTLGNLEIFPTRSSLNRKRIRTLVPVISKDAKVEKIKIAQGSFPDQIQADSYGNIWFTQPSNNLITAFRPKKKKWFHKVVGNSPDGIFVDKWDKVWFGEYDAEHLGVYDIKSKEYKRYKIPYASSSPAIPYLAQNGLVWLTDHQSNKVLSFDQKTETFKVYPVPTAGAWPVDSREHMSTGDIYISECYANKFGKISQQENGKYHYSEISLSVSGCPAFLTIVNNKVWSALWTQSSLISYDIETQEVAEYRITGDTGFGPIDHNKDGMIIFGSLKSGKVYKFDPRSEKLAYVKGVGRLKDGLTIDHKGYVWVTESGPYIYKIKF